MFYSMKLPIGFQYIKLLVNVYMFVKKIAMHFSGLRTCSETDSLNGKVIFNGCLKHRFDLLTSIKSLRCSHGIFQWYLSSDRDVPTLKLPLNQSEVFRDTERSFKCLVLYGSSGDLKSVMYRARTSKLISGWT